MSEPRIEKVSVEAFIKRSWPMLLVGAVFVVGMSAGLVWYALADKTHLPETVSASGTALGATTTSPAPESLLIPRALDGRLVPPAEATLQTYGVMVENSPDARPLSGPARANVVIEAPVEGGITRFLLLFDATTTVDQIGPVRSARPYFVDWANSLKAVYTHVGGSPEALQKISSLLDFRNVDEFFQSKYFWRSGKRAAPHNAYTRTDLLRSLKESKGWPDGAFQPWQYDTASSTTTTSSGPAFSSVKIPYGGTFDVTWVYDPETAVYTRKQAGVVQQDADGTVVTSTNVVVLQTDAEVIDDVGRLRLRTTGTGKAWLYRGGRKFELTWSRTAGEWLSFHDKNGEAATFAPGTTWISVIPSPTMEPLDSSS